MNESCTKCGTHLEPQWKFCPVCGAVPQQVAQQTGHEHTDRERVPLKGGFSGLFFGLIAAPVLIISGGMICLTGLGIFLGVPLVIAGVLAPLIGPALGVNALYGNCPWCNAKVSGVGIFDRFSCPTCGQHIVMRKRELLKAD
jgi:predicted RNA-binding Zn-ribbon protein involved in translation (DUF1610 family)